MEPEPRPRARPYDLHHERGASEDASRGQRGGDNTARVTAASVTLDASGRIVLTYSDGTTKTIDSPLENLALYVELLNTGTLAGVDAASLGTLSYLVDGILTAEDLAVAASLFVAASDKTVSITTDAIVYMNSILGIDGALAGDYVDYTSFTYDREAVYGDMTLEALVQQDDGSWVVETVNVYDAVFNSVPTGDLDYIAAFTTRGDGHDSGGGHDTGGEHDTGDEHDDCGSGDDCGGSHEDGDHGSSGGRGRRAGRSEGRGHGSGGSVRDIFRNLDDTEVETRRGSVRGGPVGGGGHE